MAKGIKRDAHYTSLVKIVAQKEGVSESLVRKVDNGIRTNEKVMAALINYRDAREIAWKKNMHQQINELVPFD